MKGNVMDFTVTSSEAEELMKKLLPAGQFQGHIEEFDNTIVISDIGPNKVILTVEKSGHVRIIVPGE